MSIHAIIGLDHLPKMGVGGDFRNYSPPCLTWWSANRSSVPIQIGNDGWIRSNYASGIDAVAQVTNPATLSDKTKLIFIGLRLRVDAVGSTGASNPRGVMLDQTLEPQTVSGRSYLFLIGQNELPAIAAGKEYYVELELNVETYVVRRWIDNVQLSDITVPANILRTMLAARQFILAMFTSTQTNANGRLSYRDIYISDDVETEDDKNVTKLGPRRIVPVTIQAAEGQDWVSTSGNGLVQDLQVPLTSAGNGVTSPATPTPLEVTLSAAVPAGYGVSAIQMQSSAYQAAGASMMLDIALEKGGSSKALSSHSLSTTTRHGLAGKPQALSPDGLVWDNAIIGQTKLVLTPR